MCDRQRLSSNKRNISQKNRSSNRSLNRSSKRGARSCNNANNGCQKPKPNPCPEPEPEYVYLDCCEVKELVKCRTCANDLIASIALESAQNIYKTPSNENGNGDDNGINTLGSCQQVNFAYQYVNQDYALQLAQKEQQKECNPEPEPDCVCNPCDDDLLEPAYPYDLKDFSYSILDEGIYDINVDVGLSLVIQNLSATEGTDNVQEARATVTLLKENKEEEITALRQKVVRFNVIYVEGRTNPILTEDVSFNLQISTEDEDNQASIQVGDKLYVAVALTQSPLTADAPDDATARLVVLGIPGTSGKCGEAPASQFNVRRISTGDQYVTRQICKKLPVDFPIC